MIHTPLPHNINREDFSLWGETLMRSSNKFDISRVTSQKSSPANFNLSEEETMCAIGCAALMGIGNPERYNLEDNETGRVTFQAGGWNEYSFNVFGVEKVNDYKDIGNRMGVWVASDVWESVDPTAKGAGQRILYMLDFGVPDWDSMFDMINGKTNLCYTEVGLENDKKSRLDLVKMFDIDNISKVYETRRSAASRFLQEV